jgi:hypothetical protein
VRGPAFKHHGSGDAARVVELEVGVLGELGKRLACEKAGVDALLGRFGGDRPCAVFVKFEARVEAYESHRMGMNEMNRGSARST